MAETAAQGATSVAEAVKRVADAAVAEVSKVAAVDTDLDFKFSGVRGGRFVCEGPTAMFGTSGTVKLGGVQLKTVAWSTQRIEGFLPADAPNGDVTVAIDDKIVRKGRFRG